MKTKMHQRLKETGPTPPDQEYARFCKILTLCVAYAANVGGIGTLTGTPPNLVLKNQLDQ